MASTIKVTDIAYPGSANTAITINANDSVSMNGGVVSPQTGFKNRIINGGMTIDQRGGTVTSPSGSVVYGIDRWRIVRFNDTTGTFTLQQSTTVPTGFKNSGLITVTADQISVPSNGLYRLDQLIEGLNVLDLGWGTASAQAVTIGFWVRSSVTGTYGARLCNSDENRSYVFQYTVNAANTYEYKTATIPGDTSGTWLTTNGIGIGLNFDLGSGSSFEGTANAWNASNVCRASGNVRLINTNGATFYITGVQLEKGSTATPFEFRSIGTEFALCQRYYETVGYDILNIGYSTNLVTYYKYTSFNTVKRAAPTVTYTNYGANGFNGTYATNIALTTGVSWSSVANYTGAGSLYAVAQWFANAEL
jgi:hypothetical protein